MAIEFFTGFEGFASGDYNSSSVSALSSIFDSFDNQWQRICSYGFNGSQSLATEGATKNCIAAKTKVVGCHFNPYDTSGFSSLISFIGPNITIGSFISGIVTVKVNGSEIYRTDATLPTNNTHHIEAKVFSDASTGTVQVKINGSLVIDLSGQNTGGQDITAIKWETYYGNESVDNIFIADDWQGELYSLLITPSVDESVQFTPLSGTDNFAMLATNDGDTSYVESDTLLHKDLYGYEDIPVGLEPLCATVMTFAKKVGTGERKLQIISKQDAVEYNETNEFVLGTTYQRAVGDGMLNVRSLAPDGTAWTREKINAMQWGFKVTG